MMLCVLNLAVMAVAEWQASYQQILTSTTCVCYTLHRSPHAHSDNSQYNSTQPFLSFTAAIPLITSDCCLRHICWNFVGEAALVEGAPPPSLNC